LSAIGRPPQQRHTAKGIHRRVVDGAVVAETTLRDYVRRQRELGLA
jgi:hypothetical protein